jgi:hypothetical protein
MKTTKNKLGLLHSYNDEPSVVDEDGNQYWHINGMLDRLDNSDPCVVMVNGDKCHKLKNGYKSIGYLREEYFNLNNKYHREDGPASKF